MNLAKFLKDLLPEDCRTKSSNGKKNNVNLYSFKSLRSSLLELRVKKQIEIEKEKEKV